MRVTLVLNHILSLEVVAQHAHLTTTITVELISHAYTFLTHTLAHFQVSAKQMGTTPCGCALKCFDKISEEQRKKLFTAFWDTGDFNVQNAYIHVCGCVRVLKAKKKYTKAPASRRKYSRVYYVKNGALSEQVCKSASSVYIYI
jgi:hypothetical protein